MNKTESQDITIIIKFLLFTLLFFHVFINKNQTDFIYILVSFMYMLDSKFSAKATNKAFLEALVLLLIIPVLLVLNMEMPATILADYVFILFLIGLVRQYKELLWEQKHKTA